MEHKIGTLVFTPGLAKSELLAGPVRDMLASFSGKDGVFVAPIDSSLSDTAAFCTAYQIPPLQAGNCIVLRSKSEEGDRYAAIVVRGDRRADINGIVREKLGGKKVSFAKMEDAVLLSRMEFGAITPIGLPPGWRILLDASLAEVPLFIIGSGIRSSKVALSFQTLAALPHVEVVENLSAPREAH